MNFIFDPDRPRPGTDRTTRAFRLSQDPFRTGEFDTTPEDSDALSRGPSIRARGGLVTHLKLHRDEDDQVEAPAAIPFPSALARDAGTRDNRAGSSSSEHSDLVSGIDAAFSKMGLALDALADDLAAIPFPDPDDDDNGPWAA